MVENVLEKRVDRLEVAKMELIYQFRKTEMQIKKLSQEMREFKEEMRAFKEEMRIFREESERDRKSLHEEIKAFKEEMKKYREKQDEESKRWRKEWSNIAKKLGILYEDFVRPVIPAVLEKYFNCEVRMEGQRRKRRLEGEEDEVDAVVVSDDKVFMVEVRSTPYSFDIKEVKEKSRKFFRFSPEFEGKELIIIFGSIALPDDVIKYASRLGVYVMGWRERVYMDILNSAKVK